MTKIKKLLAVIGLGLLIGTTSTLASTAGTVNGIKITVNEANQALKELTRGKMTWAKLPNQGRKQLIEMMAPSKLIGSIARKQLSSKEKQVALSSFWMQKKMSRIRISDQEAKNAYYKMKKMAKKMKSKNKIPSFSKAKNGIKAQLAQDKIVSQLMRRAKIKLK